MSEDIFKRALEMSLDESLEELNALDIPDYDFSPEFLKEMDALVQSQDCSSKRKQFKAAWVTAMSAAVAAVCILLGVYDNNYISRKPNTHEETVATETVITSALTTGNDQTAANVITSTQTKKEKQTQTQTTTTEKRNAPVKTTMSHNNAVSSAPHSSVTSERQDTDVSTNFISESGTAISETSAVATTVSSAVTSNMTVTTTDINVGESEMKKSAKQRLAALISAISVISGNSGIISSAEVNTISIDAKNEPVLYVAENLDQFDYDSNGKIDLDDVYLLYLYVNNNEALPDSCKEKIEGISDFNKDGLIDNTDVELFISYDYFYGFKDTCYVYDEITNLYIKWDNRKYIYGTQRDANDFRGIVEKHRYNQELYEECQYDYIFKLDKEGKIDLDVNDDGMINLLDLYDIWLYEIITGEENSDISYFFGMETGRNSINLSDEEKDEICEKCGAVYNKAKLWQENSLKFYFALEKYILTNTDITVEQTTPEYYANHRGELNVYGRKVEDVFVDRIYQAMIDYLKLDISNEEDDVTVENDDFSYIILENENSVAILRYLGESEKVEIPSEIEGYPVTKICKNAFSGTDVVEVTLPDSVTTIDDNAFDDCESLKKINFSDGLTSIGREAFYDCSSLEEVILPDSVQHIGIRAFSECSKLKSFVFSDGVKVIPGYMFYNCFSLESVTLPENVSEIKDYAFSECTKLKSIEFPEGLKVIGSFAFEQCHELKSVDIPEGVEFIGNHAFSDCVQLAKVKINNGIQMLEADVFYKCKQLTEVELPESLKCIDSYAFEECTSLSEIVLPENLKYIFGNAFSKCEALKEITLPKSLERIEIESWKHDLELNVYAGSNAEMYAIMSGIDYKLIDPENADGKCEGKCGDNAYWKYEDGTLTISGTGATYDYANIEDYSINTTAEPISPFTKIENIKYIVVEEGITELGKNIFNKCYFLSTITLPESLMCIEESAFESCYFLQSISIPDSVTRIGGSAFADCGFTSISIPDKVTSIEDKTFYSCLYLESISLPDSITSIGNGAFSCCYSLTSVNIPDSVTYIGKDVFYRSEKLKSVFIPDSVTEIEKNTYDMDSSFTFTGVKGSYAEKYASKEYITFSAGDANCDGKVNMADVVTIMQALCNPDEYKMSEQGAKSADIYETGDGVTNSDALAIQKKLLKIKD